MEKEKNRLEKVAQAFSMADGFNGYMTKYRVDTILDRCPQGGTLLDIGSADAFMSEILSLYYTKITAVDGSDKLIECAKQKTQKNNIEFVYSLIEDFKTSERFNVVLLSFILEHVVDPVSVLKKTKLFLAKNGIMFVMVPNALSLHRRVGQKLGLISTFSSLNKTDIRQGHRRVYTTETLIKDITDAGLKVLERGTFFIKPFANPQMELINREICDTLYKVSKDISELELGSMIYIKVKQ